MPELPNYVHIYSIIWVTWESFVGDVMDRNYDAITFILTFMSRRPGVANFADIISYLLKNITILFTINITIIFIKTIF